MKASGKYKVLGLMSGTSMDGLDIACCTFKQTRTGWEYSIEKAMTVKYPSAWHQKLSTAHLISGEELMALDAEYGKYLGNVCAKFISLHKFNVDFISSHGHTIFHQPSKSFTYQLGNGNLIHAVTGLPVVYDFRSLDVALGGEGAPLVPAGDRFLFSNYDVCLNLGGIANMSTEIKNSRKAFDICFCNMALNYLSQKLGKEFDDDGKIAVEGEVNEGMLAKLKKLYSAMSEKRPSLGREIFEKQMQPLLDQPNVSVEDKLRTVTESSALEIVQSILELKRNPNVLCTGGGTFNSFLITRMLEHAGDDASLIIPDESVTKFKEALVFSFLGLLKILGEVNSLKSVTHASRDSSSGVMVGFQVS
jgi:anhydro-N-acetylmuramic acid kinase